MPLLRTTFVYQLQRYGFTETWYRDASSVDPKVELVAAKLYATERAKLSGAQTECIAIRISNVDDRRQKAYLEYVSYKGNQEKNQDLTFKHGSTAPSVALNMMFQNLGNTQEKTIQLRGLWDDIEFDGGRFAFNDPVYVALIQGFGAKIREIQYGWRYQSIKRTAQILGLTQDDNGILSFTFGPAAGGGGVNTMFTATEATDGANIQIRLSEMVDSKNLNGQVVVNVESVNTASSIRPIASRPFVSGGKASRPVYAFTKVDDGRVQRVGHRQAGAPLLLSAGRGRVRARG